ncbi:unnamed protein product [Prunus brigantina]
MNPSSSSSFLDLKSVFFHRISTTGFQLITTQPIGSLRLRNLGRHLNCSRTLQFRFHLQSSQPLRSWPRRRGPWRRPCRSRLLFWLLAVVLAAEVKEGEGGLGAGRALEVAKGGIGCDACRVRWKGT